MKTYLDFTLNGDITEHKTKDNIFNMTNFDGFNFFKNCNYKKLSFIIIYNDHDIINNNVKNITELPFIDFDIFGNFILLQIDINNNIISITENKFLKLIPSENNCIIDYSSDDF